METIYLDTGQIEVGSDDAMQDQFVDSPRSGRDMGDDFREQMFTRSPQGKSETSKGASLLLEGGDNSDATNSADVDKEIDDSEEGGINSLNSRANRNKGLITAANRPRAYHIDWLRSAAIALVIVVHCLINSFAALGYNEVDNPDALQKKDGTLR
jgi:hypothetical protein